MKTSQTGNPFELELYAVIDGGYDRESELHAEYADFRIKGEWFTISRSDVDRIVNLDTDEEDNIPESELPEIDTIKIRVTTVEETEVRKTTEYICKKCGREFKEKRYLAQHNRRKTPCDKEFQCKKCFKVFNNTHDLKRHENRKTPCAPGKKIDKKKQVEAVVKAVPPSSNTLLEMIQKLTKVVETQGTQIAILMDKNR